MWLRPPFVTAMKGGGMRRVQGLVWLGGATLVSQARVGPKRLTDSQTVRVQHSPTSPSLSQNKTIFAVTNQVLPVCAAFISSVSSVEVQSQPLRLLPETSGKGPVSLAPIPSSSDKCGVLQTCPSALPLAAGRQWARRRENRLPGGRFGGHRIYKALTFPTPLSPLSLKYCSTTCDD